MSCKIYNFGTKVVAAADPCEGSHGKGPQGPTIRQLLTIILGWKGESTPPSCPLTSHTHTLSFKFLKGVYFEK